MEENNRFGFVRMGFHPSPPTSHLDGKRRMHTPTPIDNHPLNENQVWRVKQKRIEREYVDSLVVPYQKKNKHLHLLIKDIIIRLKLKTTNPKYKMCVVHELFQFCCFIFLLLQHKSKEPKHYPPNNKNTKLYGCEHWIFSWKKMSTKKPSLFLSPPPWERWIYTFHNDLGGFIRNKRKRSLIWRWCPQDVELLRLL